MNCDECKNNPATVHLTQMINGKKVDAHLCGECAAKKGFLLFDMDNKFSIPNFLGSFLGSDFSLPNMHQASSHPSSCPRCGIHFTDIKQTGKLGCSECYTAFDRQLEPTLRRIHGNSQHIGKFPVRGGEKVLLKKQIEQFKVQLQQAVLEENYEKAAEIRDQIKSLEKGLD